MLLKVMAAAKESFFETLDETPANQSSSQDMSLLPVPGIPELFLNTPRETDMKSTNIESTTPETSIPLRRGEKHRGSDPVIVNTGFDRLTAPALNPAFSTEALQDYLNTIKDIDLLSHTQEIELAKRIETGDQEALKNLIYANLRLVVPIAKRYTFTGIPLIDLIQEGNIGLMEAAKKYDWRRNTRFSTHATWIIRKAISRETIKQKRLIRLPEYMDTAVRRIGRERGRLLQELGRMPTDKELQTILQETYNLQLDEDEIYALEAADNEPLSLDISIGDENDEIDDDSLQDRIALTSTHQQAADEARRAATKQSIDVEMVNILTPRERRVIQLRFGLGDNPQLPLERVGKELGVSRERVRQIEQTALNKLHSSKTLEQMYS